jgi:hypothetical protein
MKKIFTLYAVLALFIHSSNAQINENFENGLAPLEGDCWQFTDMMYAYNPSPFVINGNGSLYSEPPVSSDSIRIMRTPFLSVETSIDVSFVYRLSNNLNGQASRYIKIALIDAAGDVVQALDSFQINNSATSSTLYSQTFSVNVPGVYRLSITMGGKTGAGNVRLSLDDLYVSSTVVGCDASKVLPVHLISFQGNLNKNNKVTLNWTVADNETAYAFEVERSNNGRDFTTIGVVFASEKIGSETYVFYETVNSGDKIMYRLKMIDKGHDVDYSKVLIFNLKTSVSNNIKIIGNPVIDKITFSYTSPSMQPVSINVYEMSGKMVMNKKVNMYEGNNIVSLPLSATFTSGMYVVEVVNGTDLQTAKFIKQ